MYTDKEIREKECQFTEEYQYLSTIFANFFVSQDENEEGRRWKEEYGIERFMSTTHPIPIQRALAEAKAFLKKKNYPWQVISNLIRWNIGANDQEAEAWFRNVIDQIEQRANSSQIK